jgi:uncharacterized membrane protein
MIDIIASFLTPPVITFILGGAPVAEIKGASVYAFQQGQPDLIVFGIIGNVFASICLLLFWDILHIQKIGMMIIGKSIEKRIDEFHKKHENDTVLALTLLIGMPIPLIGGAYTGILLGKVLKVENRKLFLASTVGILLTAFIMYLAFSGTVSFLSFLKQ